MIIFDVDNFMKAWFSGEYPAETPQEIPQWGRQFYQKESDNKACIDIGAVFIKWSKMLRVVYPSSNLSVSSQRALQAHRSAEENMSLSLPLGMFEMNCHCIAGRWRCLVERWKLQLESCLFNFLAVSTKLPTRTTLNKLICKADVALNPTVMELTHNWTADSLLFTCQ